MHVGPVTAVAVTPLPRIVPPETMALMMQAMGTNLPRPVSRVLPYPRLEEPRIKAIAPIEAYREQMREPTQHYIDVYC